MVTVTPVGVATFRLDGWLTPPAPYDVRLRLQGATDRETRSDERGPLQLRGAGGGLRRSSASTRAGARRHPGRDGQLGRDPAVRAVGSAGGHPPRPGRAPHPRSRPPARSPSGVGPASAAHRLPVAAHPHRPVRRRLRPGGAPSARRCCWAWPRRSSSSPVGSRPRWRLLREAEEVAADLDAPGLLASVRGQRGLLLLRSGPRRQALRRLRRRRRGPAQPHGPTTRSRSCSTAACCTSTSARCDQAAAGLPGVPARSPLRRGDPLLTWKARHNLAYVDFLAGRIPRALAAWSRRRRARRARPRPDRAAGPGPGAARGRPGQRRRPCCSRGPRASSEQAGLHQDAGRDRTWCAPSARWSRATSQRARALARSPERLFARRGNVLWQRRAAAAGAALRPAGLTRGRPRGGRRGPAPARGPGR